MLTYEYAWAARIVATCMAAGALIGAAVRAVRHG